MTRCRALTLIRMEMGALQQKRIVVGVTGGIAAYKTPDFVRRLREQGADVRVVMTRGAAAFVTPLTLQAVSGHAVHQTLLDTETESAMGHIELARWADAVVIAPASADTLARLAQGRADELLDALCLATTATVAVAPAMNQQMWAHAATQANVATLRARGIHILGPASGEQACGEIGAGRMLEPLELVAATAGLFEHQALAGSTVVVTAGPTWEPLDPVRGLSNRSSGKMGYAVAQAAREAGARVVLVSGPVHLDTPAGVEKIAVTTAEEMAAAVAAIGTMDIFIGVAAVADYRPVRVADQKIKKTADAISLELARNRDILTEVAARRPAPYSVGFAAETTDLEKHAREKLLRKGLDLIAANPVNHNRGFDQDDNELILIHRSGSHSLPRQPKTRLARELILYIAEQYHAQRSTEDSRSSHR